MDYEKKNSVLIVDDENSNIMLLTQILEPEYVVYPATSGKKAIKASAEYSPDVILIDVHMPEMDGFAVLSALKNSDATRETPVIFTTEVTNPDDEEKGLDMGAADYIHKPFSPAVVRLRVKNQIKMLNSVRMVELLSMIDQLTSIPNRRGFDNRMDMEWIRAIRENTTISLLMMDIDNFKEFNDKFGHQQGDRVLQAVAKTITRSLCRPGDYAARWGGEEFVALLPSTDLKGALGVAEKIRANIGEVVIPCADGSESKVTISIGVNTQTPQRAGSSCEVFIAEADRELYRAKNSGKNRVCYGSQTI